jgi:hypothetical protein
MKQCQATHFDESASPGLCKSKLNRILHQRWIERLPAAHCHWTLLVALALFLLTTTSLLSAAELHAVFQTNRTYMGYTRTTERECWFGDRKSYSLRKSDPHVWLYRGDLGVQWFVDLGDSVYGEESISSAGEPEVREDIHTKGVDYEPEYEWIVKGSSETKEINGFSCRGISAKGIADFAQTDLTLWFSNDRTLNHTGMLNDMLLDFLRNAGARKFILDILQKDTTALLVQIEQIEEPAIAPTITLTLAVKQASEEQAPPGIFDVPAGFKKEDAGN